MLEELEIGLIIMNQKETSVTKSVYLKTHQLLTFLMKINKSKKSQYCYWNI